MNPGHTSREAQKPQRIQCSYSNLRKKKQIKQNCSVGSFSYIETLKDKRYSPWVGWKMVKGHNNS
jgi:hypothetical protein